MVLNKSLAETSNSSNKTSSLNSSGNNFYEWNNKKGSVVQKSQKNFADKIDNSMLPFVPKIRQKPNALAPLSGKKERIILISA